jgi:hypothetical protein
MTVAAETAVRAWVNSRPDLVGTQGAPGPLGHGAYLIGQVFPSGGAFAVISRQQGTPQQMTAEDDGSIDCAQVVAEIFGGTQSAAELAAAAYATAARSLTGSPVVMGDTGITCLVADNVTGPIDVPVPPDQGELYLFHVSADFYLTGST